MFLASTPSPKAASSGRGVSDTTLSLNLAALPATARLRRKSTRHKGAYHYLTSSSNANDKKSKLTTRHLAALDFLLGIKLTNEATIRKEGQKLKVITVCKYAVYLVVQLTYFVVMIFIMNFTIPGTCKRGVKW